MKIRLDEGASKHSPKGAYAKAVADYRKTAGIPEGTKITEDMLDTETLEAVALDHGMPSSRLKKRVVEDMTVDQAAQQLEAEAVQTSKANQIEAVLDRSLAIARRKQRKGDTEDFPNVLLIADAGMGKTSIVRQWAKSRGVNLVQKNLGTMGPEAFGGIIARDADDARYATRLGTNEMIKALEKPDSVLFLDEYNRSKTEVRGAVLTLVQNHMVWDPTAPGDERFLDNFLFTVAAINPPNTAYIGTKEMDPAEMSRFYSVNISPDPEEHLAFLERVYQAEIEDEASDEEERREAKGRLALARAILHSEDFTYDSSEEVEAGRGDPHYKPLNYRSFKMALDRSDGTKDDFLNTWSHYCNPAKLQTIRDILADYKDVDDEANAVLQDETESEVFKGSDLLSRLRKGGVKV